MNNKVEYFEVLIGEAGNVIRIRCERPSEVYYTTKIFKGHPIRMYTVLEDDTRLLMSTWAGGEE